MSKKTNKKPPQNLDTDHVLFTKNNSKWDFPGGSVVNNLSTNAGDTGHVGSTPGLERLLRRGNLKVYSPWDCKESDMTEHAQDILKTARLKVYPLSQE